MAHAIPNTSEEIVVERVTGLAKSGVLHEVAPENAIEGRSRRREDAP
jgi:hypothetical protein